MTKKILMVYILMNLKCPQEMTLKEKGLLSISYIYLRTNTSRQNQYDKNDATTPS